MEDEIQPYEAANKIDRGVEHLHTNGLRAERALRQIKNHLAFEGT